MARVIKGGGNQPGAGRGPRAPTRVLVDPGQKKVIEREVFAAKQDAEHILKRAEEERQRLLAEGKRKAAQAREEAMARGASEAFAAAASEALAAFRKRAERYGEAADDIRILALEVVKKVLGNDPDLGPKDVERILHKGLAELRARRRLRLQVPERRMAELTNERPNLMKALQSEPDLLIEGASDVGIGFARVVTEIGGALCAEETALDALSQAVNVREVPRAHQQSTGKTDVGLRPAELRASELPDAAVEEDEPTGDPSGEGEDETVRLQPRKNGRAAALDDVEEIEAIEEEASQSAARPPRVATGQVKAPARPATRVVPIGAERAPSDDDSTLRQPPLDRSEEDEDLDLFTDDAVGTRKKRR